MAAVRAIGGKNITSMAMKTVFINDNMAMTDVVTLALNIFATVANRLGFCSGGLWCTKWLFWVCDPTIAPLIASLN